MYNFIKTQKYRQQNLILQNPHQNVSSAKLDDNNGSNCDTGYCILSKHQLHVYLAILYCLLGKCHRSKSMQNPIISSFALCKTKQNKSFKNHTQISTISNQTKKSKSHPNLNYSKKLKFSLTEMEFVAALKLGPRSIPIIGNHLKANRARH